MKQARKPAEEKPEEERDGDYTSRLLAAKRRARGQAEENKGGDDG